jgi:hypothetical protein
MMSEIQFFGCSLCITYAGTLLSLVIGTAMLWFFGAISPQRTLGVGETPSPSACLGEGNSSGARKGAKRPYAQGEADALTGRPCLYGPPMPGRPYSERLYYSGYHDTLDRIRREAREAERLLR